MRKPSPLPEPLARRPFDVARAKSLGVAEGRLRGTDLDRPFHGVRTPRALPVDPIVAYAARMPQGQFFSHLTAARLWELPLPARYRHDSSIHVSVVSPARAPRSKGVLGHRVDAADVLLRNRLQLASPIDTWCALATVLSVDELVIMGDALVRRKDPLYSMDRIREVVALHRGRRGQAALEQAAAMIRARTDSPKESELRLVLAAAGLPEPTVNGRILDGHGAFVAFGDLVYFPWKVVVEYEGRHHAEDSATFARDITRLDDVMQLGFRVVRIDNTMLAPRRPAIARVRSALESRGWHP